MLSSSMAASYEIDHCEHSHQEQQSQSDHSQTNDGDQCKNHCPIPHIFFTQFERCFNTVSTLIHYEEIESIVAAMTATFLAKVDRPPIA